MISPELKAAVLPPEQRRLLGMKCKAIIDRAESKDYLDIVAILRHTDLTLADGLAAAVAIYGKDFVPLSSLKALAYTVDLPESLSEDDQTLLRVISGRR